MDFRFEEGPNELTVSLSGRFTFADALPFAKVLDRLTVKRDGRAVFDLRCVEFIDSAALGLLLLARDAAGRVDLPLLLRVRQGPVRRLLGMVRFDDLFAIEEA